jgi:hypothetical protein
MLNLKFFKCLVVLPVSAGTVLGFLGCEKKSNQSRAGMDVLGEEGNFLALPIIESRVLDILNKQNVIGCGRLASSYSLCYSVIFVK